MGNPIGGSGHSGSRHVAGSGHYTPERGLLPRPHFDDEQCTCLFHARFARATGLNAVSLRRAELLASLRAEPETIAEQGAKFLCNAWCSSSRMGRMSRACVLRCVAREDVRHCADCPPLLVASTVAGGGALPFFGVLATGHTPDVATVHLLAFHSCHVGGIVFYMAATLRRQKRHGNGMTVTW